MSEYQIQTRRRSRSRTPFIPDSETDEAQKKKSVAPTVQTIIEEVVEVTSSSSLLSTPPKQSKAALKQTNSQKTKTSDYSSEEQSPEMRKQQLQQEMRFSPKPMAQDEFGTGAYKQMETKTTTTKSTTTISSGTKQIFDNISAATSTPKSNSIFGNFTSQFSSLGGGLRRRSKEVAQNEINSEFEKSQLEQQNNRSFSRIFSSSFTSGMGGKQKSSAANDNTDHLAYLEYKRAGEYWKKTPKTDYTYSELSPHRRVLAPGVVAMPNMSRRSLENHHDRINFMVQRDPAQESYIRRRYESNKHNQYGDEGDYGAYHQQLVTESWWRRVITTITTTMTRCRTAIFGQSTGGPYGQYARKTYAVERRGIFGRIGHSMLGVLHYLYTLFSSIFLLDSRDQRRSKGRRILFWILLLLLPLLLLAAWTLLDSRQQIDLVDGVYGLVPIAMFANLRNAVQDTAITMQKTVLELPAMMRSATNQYFNKETLLNIKIEEAQRNMQRGLSQGEYEQLLNHVNDYIQQLVELRFREQDELIHRLQVGTSQTISPQQMEVIVKVIGENLEKFGREKRNLKDRELRLATLSDEEVDNLANLVLQQLRATGWPGDEQSFRLTAANVQEIKRLIQQQLETNNSNVYAFLVEKIDLDALLARILGAAKLGEFIDGRIHRLVDDKLAILREQQQQLLLLQKQREQAAESSSGQGPALLAAEYEQQKRLIDNLNAEMSFIKLSLSSSKSENEGLMESISKLQLSYDGLMQRLQDHELATDKRFSTLLSEIEQKLLLLKDDQFTQMNKQIKLSLVEILGFKSGSGNGLVIEDQDLQNWVRSVFVAKDYLEQRLAEINERTNHQIRDEIDRSGYLLMHDISERLKKEILLAVELKQNATATTLRGQIKAALSEEEVRNIVKSVLAIYDADKTGLVDFALESAGGQILSTRCTENYQTKSAQISVFGIPLWYPTNTPRVAISPNVQPGECWAFQGFPGFLVLKLNSLVYVTGFTLEHIPRSLSPTGRIESAPRNFTVWGLEHEKDYEPILFGEYEFADTDASLQYFPVQNTNINRPYDIVELRIESNHGHPQYTCLYRFRVHGKPPNV